MDSAFDPHVGVKELAHAPRWRCALLAALFTALGLAGNLVRLPLAFNVDFIFGSIFTLMATALLGRGWGIGCAILASLYTFFLWNHPYAILILAAEALWVGTALRRGHRNLLLADTLFWLLAGSPLVLLFYGGVQHLGAQTTLVIALKQTINGVMNALLAGIAVRYLPLDAWLGLPRRSRRFPLSTVIFDFSLLCLLAPTVGLIFAISRKSMALEEEKVVSLLTLVTRDRQASLEDWMATQLRSAQAIVAAGEACGLAPSARLQGELQRIKDLSPDFHNLILADGQARAVGFIPLLNAAGRPNLGLDFSDHDYVRQLRATLEPVISEVFVGSRAVLQPIFTVSAPLVRDGRLAGYGTGALDLDRLRAALVRGGTGQWPFLTLLDGQGHVVTTTDPGLRPLEPWPEPAGTRYEPISGEVFRRVPKARQNVSVMSVWREARYTTRLPVGGTRWVLVADLPTEPLRQRAFAIATWGLAALAGLYLLALVLAMAGARLLGRASARLAAFSRDLPARIEAEERLEWPDTRFEEVASLTDHFKATAEALGARILALKVETERRLAGERALIQQSRLAAMGEMIGNIAHQWRQPLNALNMILINLEDAWRFGQFTEAQLHESVGRADRLIQTMSSTINDFRDFFRPGKAPVGFSARRQALAAVALVEASFQQGGIDLRLEDGEDVPTLGHPNEYSQVLLNLLANARTAIEGRGGGGEVRIRVAREGGRCLLRVTDNGGGIPEPILERIFEPYFTTRPETGTGLGLYMARTILQQSMAGTVEARNVQGGAEFILATPLKEGTDVAQG